MKGRVTLAVRMRLKTEMKVRVRLRVRLSVTTKRVSQGNPIIQVSR